MCDTHMITVAHLCSIEPHHPLLAHRRVCPVQIPVITVSYLDPPELPVYKPHCSATTTPHAVPFYVLLNKSLLWSQPVLQRSGGHQQAVHKQTTAQGSMLVKSQRCHCKGELALWMTCKQASIGCGANCLTNKGGIYRNDTAAEEACYMLAAYFCHIASSIQIP